MLIKYDKRRSGDKACAYEVSSTRLEGLRAKISESSSFCLMRKKAKRKFRANHSSSLSKIK